jgi:hypothetical protein
MDCRSLDETCPQNAHRIEACGPNGGPRRRKHRSDDRQQKHAREPRHIQRRSAVEDS